MTTIRSHRARACAAALLLATVAACGSTATADPPATSAVIPNTAPSTILPPHTTAAATTIEPEAAPTTSTVPVTDPPESTTEFADVAQAVAAATSAAWHAFDQAVLDPGNDERRLALERHFSGAVLVHAREIVDGYRLRGEREITSEVVPGSVTVDVSSLRIDGDSATLELCRVNSNTWVSTAANADGSDRVIDDSIGAQREQIRLTKQDENWLVTSADTVATFPGAIACVR